MNDLQDTGTNKLSGTAPSLLTRFLCAVRVLSYESHMQEKLAEAEEDLRVREIRHKELQSKVSHSSLESGAIGITVTSIMLMCIGALSQLLILIDPNSDTVPLYLLIGIPMFFVGLTLFSFRNRIYNKTKAKLVADQTKLQEYEEREITPMINKLNKMRERINENHLDLTVVKNDVLAFLPYAYRNIYAVSFMMETIKNERADTLDKAIELFELERRYHAILPLDQIGIRQHSTINSAIAYVNQNFSVIRDNISFFTSVQNLDFLI